MWVWSDLHCDFVFPVEGNSSEIWLRNLTMVTSQGAFDSPCVSDPEQPVVHGWVVDPSNSSDHRLSYLPFKRHQSAVGYGCLDTGSCVEILAVFDTNSVSILVVGCIVSLLTILGNFMVTFSQI